MGSDESTNETAATSDQQMPVPLAKSSAVAPDVAAVLDSVVGLDPEEALPRIEIAIHELPSATATDDAELRTLQALWNFYQAIRRSRTDGAFEEAEGLLREAAQTFDDVNAVSMRDLAIAMAAYSRAIFALGQMNIGQGIQLLAQMKEYLNRAGKFGNRFEWLVRLVEPEAQFIAGIQSLMALDYASAEMFITNATTLANANADTEGDPKVANGLRGMGHFYQAFYNFSRASASFGTFDYAQFARFEFGRDAEEARKCFKKADQTNLQIKNAYHMADAFVSVAAVLTAEAMMMRRIFDSTFKPDMAGIDKLRARVHEARESAASAGEKAVVLVRFTDNLQAQLDNIEKLARPSRKDFGAFSGLVSCALFLPLFVLSSWGNSAFDLQISGVALGGTDAALALIGGFGTGAVRFKSMIPLLGGTAEPAPSKS